MNCLKCHLKIEKPTIAHYGLHPTCFSELFNAPSTAEFLSLQRRIRVITEKTRSLYDVKIFIKTTLFDALIGNHDRHGRNLAFIRTGKNITLSPIYDNISYLSLESGNMLKADFNPTGRINTMETETPSMYDYVKEFMRLGYQEDVLAFYKKTHFTHLLQLIDTSFCSKLMKHALKTLISKRFKELEYGLFHNT
jgi:hypothetical protein